MQVKITLLTTLFLIITCYAKAQSYTWSTLGNGDITPDNWLGTNSSAMLKDVIIKTNNIERMRIKGGVFFGIGLNNPNNIVHITQSCKYTHHTRNNCWAKR